MLSFLFRRLLQTIPTVLAVVALVFVLFSVVPGSIVSSMSDESDPQVELRMKKQLGLDQPVYVRFGTYIAQLAIGDFGTSFRTREQVTTMIAKRAWPTLQLIFSAMLLAVLEARCGLNFSSASSIRWRWSWRCRACPSPNSGLVSS